MRFTILTALWLCLFCIHIPAQAQNKAPNPPTMATPAHKTKAVKKRVASLTNHSAQLSWANPTTGPAITGNNIYQSTTSGGPYTKVGSSSTPITSYTISTGLVGLTTYYFVVTDTCTTCNPSESVYSNQVSGTTNPDAQPNAPTGLTLTSIN